MVNVLTRRAGFAGEHFVIVPPAIRDRALSNPLLSGLLVTEAGCFRAAAGHRADRPQGAWTHIIIACVNGQGWVKVAQRRIDVSPGEVVWIPADEPHAYGSTQNNPWTIVWAHFCGPNASRWLAEINWKDPDIHTCRMGMRGMATLGLDDVYSTLEQGCSLHHLLTARIALEHSFSSLLELTSISAAEKSAEERAAQVLESIIASPAKRYRLVELAEAAGVSVPHFINVFKKQCGFSPIDFVLRQRIRLGCELLATTTATIGSIAEKVGFKDPYYFSRSFRRIMNTSPRQYRKSIKA